MIKQYNNESGVQPAVCCCVAKAEKSDITFNSQATFDSIDPYSISNSSFSLLPPGAQHAGR